MHKNKAILKLREEKTMHMTSAVIGHTLINKIY